MNVSPSATHYLSQVRVQPDGKIVAAGFDFGSNGGDFFLVRFTPPETGVDLPVVGAAAMELDVLPNPSRAACTLRFALPLMLKLYTIAAIALVVAVQIGYR